MDTDRERWPSVLRTDGATWDALTLGVMIDESVGGEINVVCPRGSVAVTSELSVDLAWTDPTQVASLRCVGELVALTPSRALAQGIVRTESGAVVASATTWCVFIDGNGQEASGFFSEYAPPPDLALSELLRDVPPDGAAAAATLLADSRAANDLGNLHGGVLLAALHDVGLTGLAGRLSRPQSTSVRVNYLRPGLLDTPLDLRAEILHAGRSVGAARVTSRNQDGKITAIATVTGCAGTG